MPFHRDLELVGWVVSVLGAVALSPLVYRRWSAPDGGPGGRLGVPLLEIPLLLPPGVTLLAYLLRGAEWSASGFWMIVQVFCALCFPALFFCGLFFLAFFGVALVHRHAVGAAKNLFGLAASVIGLVVYLRMLHAAVMSM